MPTYTTAVDTPWSVEKTFAYLSDLRNFAEWDPGVSRAELVSGEAGGPDAVYDVTASGTTLRYAVTTFDEPNAMLVRAKNRFFTSIDMIRVEAVDSGALATYEAELKLNGPLSIFDPVLSLAFNRIGDKAAAGLERALDGARV